MDILAYLQKFTKGIRYHLRSDKKEKLFLERPNILLQNKIKIFIFIFGNQSLSEEVDFFHWGGFLGEPPLSNLQN